MQTPCEPGFVPSGEEMPKSHVEVVFVPWQSASEQQKRAQKPEPVPSGAQVSPAAQFAVFAGSHVAQI